MYSLKQSFADCALCSLLEAPSCILETNSKADLSKVEVVFVAENPGKDEIKHKPEPAPLVGKAGKMFRKYFNKHIKKDFKYLLTNCVLCATITPEGTTGNPDNDVIDRCKINCFEIIKACNPKVIVLMGTSPMKAFGLAKSGITKLRGQVFEWEGFDVIVTVHPSFIQRGNFNFEPKFEEDIKLAAEMMGKEFVKKEKEDLKDKTYGVHHYKIPEKFYTDEYRLVDIQNLNRTGEVLYIFRDKNNKKIFHKESDEYICYQCPPDVEARKNVPYEKLYQVSVPYKQKRMLDDNITYEGDVRLTAKHAFDYYHFNKGDVETDCMNILFCDIEVDAGIDNRAFPKPDEALYPINMITSIFQEQKEIIVYVLDNETEPINEVEDATLKIFKNEKKMMMEFIKDWKAYDPDFATGWNFISFDMEYIANRLPKLGLYPSGLSKFGEFYMDSFRGSCKLAGCVVLDQYNLYRDFTFTKKANYKLGNIAFDELKITKIELDLPINEMYWKMLNKLIEYNIRDSVLLEKLEDKLQHITLATEIRIICNGSFESTASQFGQIDCNVLSFLKERGMASKNADPHVERVKYPGAYVHPPEPGIYDNLTDFDFTSLYPSIIMTYNIGMNNFVMQFKDALLGYELAYHPDQLPDIIPMIIDPMFAAKEVAVKKEDLFKKIKDSELIHTINGCFYKNHDTEESVYSLVLGDLLSSRRAYKKKMLDAKGEGNTKKKDFFNTKQLVYKVLANSLYGVIANNAFRYYNTSCAAAITLGGQEALKHSIIEGESYMEHMKTRKDRVELPPLTKKEFFADKMPDRKTEYIVTGDTDSIFTCFEQFEGEKTDERIREWCDELQNFLNSEIMENIVQRHNVKIKYSKLDLKNELIISRGLFLAKKRYAIRVVNNEGRKVDETNYMGIEIKRSDYPEASKEFMKEVIKLIFTTDNIKLSMLMKYINNKRKEFIRLIKDGDKTIARPVEYKREMSDYKSIPQGVRAMDNFNRIAYNIHNIGARSYMFRVSGFDFEKASVEMQNKYQQFIADGGKLDVVAIPDEEAKLPEYFIPDVKANMKFCFEDRYKLLLEPLFEVKKNEGIITI